MIPRPPRPPRSDPLVPHTSLSLSGRYKVPAHASVQRYKASKELLPGIGHPHHKPDDPRPAAIFRAAYSNGAAGDHIRSLKLLSACVDDAFSRHITINAPGAISAAFLDIGIPPRIMRGFHLVARCAGQIGRVHV